MPYVKQELRPDLEVFVEPIVNALSCNDPDTDGKVVYIMCRIMYKIYGRNSFSILNRAKGIFSNAQDEFTRRVIWPYEDRKCEENGDVFEEWNNDKG